MFQGLGHQMLLLWFVEKACGILVSWTQANSLPKPLGIFL